MAPLEMGTMVVAGVAAAGRMPSMEAEPKTLTLEQLKFAREAAMYVVSTQTREEAIRIFTEGLKPVRGVRKQRHLVTFSATATATATATDSSSDDDIDGDSSQDSTPRGRGAGCRRRHGPRSIKRDIATAPI